MRSLRFFERTLGITAASAVVLAAVFLTGVGEQLWEPFFGKYLKERFFKELAPALWAVGIYSCVKNLLEGAFYIGGGYLSQRLGSKFSLVLFGLGPILGYILFLVGDTPAVAVAGTIMILSWEPLTVPASFSVVGERKKTITFVLHAFQKRLPKLLGPLLGGLVIGGLGWVEGPETMIRVALGAAVLALVLQAWLLPPGGTGRPLHGLRSLWRSMDSRLKGLLAAEVLTRWCDWFVRDMVVLYCTEILRADSRLYGTLVAIQMGSSLVSYLPAGVLSDRGHRRALIGLTFFFFAAFPAVLALSTPGAWAIPVLAFMAYGLREIGEPTRKAVITFLMPEGRKAEGVGAYWGLRTFAICPAPLAGAWIWTSFGAQALLWTAAAFGAAALLVYGAISRGLDAQVEKA